MFVKHLVVTKRAGGRGNTYLLSFPFFQQTPKGTYSFLPQRVNVHMVYVKLYECKPGAACAAVCWCQELRHAGNLL